MSVQTLTLILRRQRHQGALASSKNHEIFCQRKRWTSFGEKAF